MEPYWWFWMKLLYSVAGSMAWMALAISRCTANISSCTRLLMLQYSLRISFLWEHCLFWGAMGVPRGWKWGGSRAEDGQWGKGWAVGQAGLLQDKDHLPLQTVEGLMQAGQHPLIVVLVVQCSCLYSQHVLVVQGMELPEAAHILLLCLVPFLVCEERLWKTPTASTSPVLAPGQGSEGEGWERDPGQAGGPSLGWLHCDTGMLLTNTMVSQGLQISAWLLGGQAGLSSVLPAPRTPTHSSWAVVSTECGVLQLSLMHEGSWKVMQGTGPRLAPLLASWYLRLAWALSRARLRYCAFSFSISCCVVWRETQSGSGSSTFSCSPAGSNIPGCTPG